MNNRARKPKSYEFHMDERTGTLYLRRERPPFLGELPYVAALVATVMFALVSCCQYIQIRTLVDERLRQTQALERQYEDLRENNLSMEKEAFQIQNLDEIYEVATTELGMVQASQEHVVIYDRTNSEFVYQTDNIPIFGYQ